ncbi:MAG TPA: hypothetical protein VFZ34_09420 [Blastocatellia bacterium]|nr:hypothetical protein [Blastocatellia bacterium]
MHRKTIVALFVTVIACVTFAQTTKPNLTGTWERVALEGSGNPGTESMLIVHNEPYFYLLYRIKDEAGARTLDLKGMTDGKMHPQEVDGQPAMLMLWWEGQHLMLDIKRQASYGYTHNRRKLTFSPDGKTFTVERSQHLQDGTLRGSGTEKWEKK